MAKGNLFLGHARGKVGSVVFTRLDGAQITRSLNNAPKNPRTDAQMVQRAIAATVMQAYSAMQKICNHSFEGIAYGMKSQQHFMKINMDRLSELYKMDPDSISVNQKGVKGLVANNFIIAQGSLHNPLLPEANSNSVGFDDMPMPNVDETPDAFLSRTLGLAKEKDQLTIVRARLRVLSANKTMSLFASDSDSDTTTKHAENVSLPFYFAYARLIRNAVSDTKTKYVDTDQGKTAFTAALKKLVTIEDPNEIGIDKLLGFGGDANPADLAITNGAYGSILSSFDADKGWLRSNAYLVIPTNTWGLRGSLIPDYWMADTSIALSAKYLNNGK